MIRYNTYIVLSILLIFTSCKAEQKHNLVVLLDDANGIEIGNQLVYLGKNIGEVTAVDFCIYNNKDRVSLHLKLSNNEVFRKSSKLNVVGNDIRLINSDVKDEMLKDGDTLFLIKDAKQVVGDTPIKIKEIATDNFEKIGDTKSLSPQEKVKMDSLKQKIEKLNQLIKEVNGNN